MSVAGRTFKGPSKVFAAGSTGNATSGSTGGDGDFDAVVLQFVVEAVGATPTVTFKWQGSYDNTNWTDAAYVTDATDTLSQATTVVTALGATVQYTTRPYRYYRCVVSANTNVTYRAEVYEVG